MTISRQIRLVLVLMGLSWLQLAPGFSQARSASEWLAHDPERPPAAGGVSGAAVAAGGSSRGRPWCCSTGPV